MRTWEDYKKTFPYESIFDYARTGDMLSLRNLLIHHPGADLNKKNHKGYSPLMLAVYNGQEDFAHALLRAGVDPDSSDNAGNTVLMGAAFKGSEEIVSLLLEFGANPHLLNHGNMSAYGWAKAFGRKNIIEFFEKNGIRPNQEESRVRNYIKLFKLYFSNIFKTNLKGVEA